MKSARAEGSPRLLTAAPSSCGSVSERVTTRTKLSRTLLTSDSRPALRSTVSLRRSNAAGDPGLVLFEAEQLDAADALEYGVDGAVGRGGHASDRGRSAELVHFAFVAFVLDQMLRENADHLGLRGGRLPDGLDVLLFGREQREKLLRVHDGAAAGDERQDIGYAQQRHRRRRLASRLLTSLALIHGVRLRSERCEIRSLSGPAVWCASMRAGDALGSVICSIPSL